MSTLFDHIDEPELVRQWRRFHAENPHVWRLFERFALEAAASGVSRIGAKAIWERMRWSLQVETSEHRRGSWRLNNSYTAHYARLFRERHPEHAELFETRRAQGDVA